MNEGPVSWQWNKCGYYGVPMIKYNCLQHPLFLFCHRFFGQTGRSNLDLFCQLLLLDSCDHSFVCDNRLFAQLNKSLN